MSSFITKSDQTKLLRTVSIYSQRGETSDQVRLLYMNDAASLVWKVMVKEPTVIGADLSPTKSRLFLDFRRSYLETDPAKLTQKITRPAKSTYSLCKFDVLLSR